MANPLTRESNRPLQPSLRGELVALLRDKRHEEALALLYRALADAPGAPELQRGIDHLKNHLIVGYAKRLGGLDRVAPLHSAATSRNPEAMLVSKYIDGTATFGDIAQTCPLGQLRTLQVLVGMFVPVSSTDAEPLSEGATRESANVLRLVARLHDPTESQDVYSIPAHSGMRERPPSAQVAAAAAEPSPEAEAEREFRSLFASGTTAYVQRRFREAVDAFEECERLRPDDKSVAVMLRRSQHDLRNLIE
jgi:hypothetical protein